MDLKTAYKIIGLPEDCSMEELRDKYYALTEERLPRNELEDIQNAYNVIRDHIKASTPEPEESFKNKLNNFFYHYKLHLIGGIILTIIGGFLIYSIIDAQIENYRESKLPPPEIEMMLFGDFFEQTDLTPMEEKIYNMFPDWERVKIELVYSPIDFETEYDIAAKQKSMALLAIEKPDMYIFDMHSFEMFIEDAVFAQLDAFESKEGTEDKWLLYQLEDDDKEHIYGIDLTDSDLFSGLEIEQDKKIAVILENSENFDNAMELLLKVVN